MSLHSMRMSANVSCSSWRDSGEPDSSCLRTERGTSNCRKKLRGGTAYKISADARAADGMFYGQIVEFSPKINRPFLYPALDAHREEIREKIVAAVRTACRRHGK